MRKWIERQKQRVIRAWVRFRLWVIGVLVSLGLVAAYAVPVDFTYTPATERVDGTPMALSEIAETKLYCDGGLITVEDGADSDISGDLGIGSHQCYGTHVDFFGQESIPSNIVTRVVNPANPGPPIFDDPPPPDP